MLFLVFVTAAALSRALAAFFSDTRLQVALALVAVDLALGVLAAWKLATFRLSFLADFARTDLAFKLAPWLVIYVGSKIAGGTFLAAADVALYAIVVAAWTGSIASSLSELGFPGAARLPGALRAGERPPPAG